MAYSDPDPEVLGRKLFLMTLVSALVFAAAAYMLVS
jgi:hypothetical protein